MTLCSRYPRELTHYSTQLKKNCFRKLKDNVWENKTKWQLMLKAQRHYHHRLIWSLFRAWQIFVVYKIGKEKKMESADKHFARKTKRKIFSALKYKVIGRTVLTKELDMLRNLKLKKRSWKYWRKYTRRSIRSKEIDLLTKKMRELYLVRTVIEQWFINYKDKNFYKIKHLRAVIHHRKVMKRQHFTLWRDYCDWKICKKKLTSYFLTRLEFELKKQFFIRLKQYTQHKKLYEKHVLCITMFYETYLVRSVVNKWNTKYEEVMDLRNREKHSLAVKFYEERLLEVYYKKLKIWSSIEKSRIDASQLLINMKIKLYIDLWRKSHREILLLNSLEEKGQKWRSNRLKQIYLTKMLKSFEQKKNESRRIKNFIRFCEDRLKAETFRKWRNFSLIKTEKKLKSHSAQCHHDKKIIRKSFRFLRVYAVRRHSKTNVLSYHNRKLLSRSFDRVKSYSRIKRFRRECVKIFQGKCKIQLLKRAFSVMKQVIVNNRNQLNFAREAANNKIKRKTFEMWRKFYELKAQNNMLIHNVRLLLQDIIIRDVISQWWTKAKVKTSFKRKLIKLKSDREKRLIKIYIRKWMDVIEKFRLIREKSKIFSELYPETILQYHISKIIDIWNRRRVLKEREHLASRAEKGLLMRRYLRRWLTFVAWRKEKLRECSARIFHLKHLQNNNEHCGYSEVKLRRKQPMIPLYLREDLYAQESTSLHRVSGSNCHDVSSPGSEKFPLIY